MAHSVKLSVYDSSSTFHLVAFAPWKINCMHIAAKVSLPSDHQSINQLLTSAGELSAQISGDFTATANTCDIMQHAEATARPVLSPRIDGYESTMWVPWHTMVATVSILSWMRMRSAALTSLWSFPIQYIRDLPTCNVVKMCC